MCAARTRLLFEDTTSKAHVWLYELVIIQSGGGGAMYVEEAKERVVSHPSFSLYNAIYNNNLNFIIVTCMISDCIRRLSTSTESEL